jgi:twitching motility protein PilI
MSKNNVKPFELLGEYERLSLLHKVQSNETQELSDFSGVGFKVDETNWVIEIDKIEEVLILTETTKIPGIASWVIGLGNIRGNLMPIIDFKAFMYGKQTKTTAHTRMVVIRQSGGQVGLVVDEIYGQKHFSNEQAIEKSLDEDNELYRYLEATFEDDSSVWNVLDLDMLINDSAFQNAAAV